MSGEGHGFIVSRFHGLMVPLFDGLVVRRGAGKLRIESNLIFKNGTICLPGGQKALNVKELKNFIP